jgi:hypothetical protein
MAYKKNTIVISVPVEPEINQILREITLLNQNKSKTKTASQILSDAVRLEYNRIRKQKKWRKNVNI